MKRFLQFIFAHSVFAAMCAAGLTVQTFLIIGEPIHFHIIAFVFLATLGSYNLYWLLSKLHFSKQKNIALFLRQNTSYILVLIICSAGMLFLYTKLLWLTVPLMLTGLLTLMYTFPLLPFVAATRFRKFGFFKTILLAFTWAYVTVVLPTWGPNSISVIAGIFFYRFAFMLLLCFMFDMRDASIDKVHNVYSLASDLPKTAVQNTWKAFFFLYVALGTIFFTLILKSNFIYSFFITSVVTYIVFWLSVSKKRGYYFYYFIVDGLMLFTSAMSLLISLLTGTFVSNS